MGKEYKYQKKQKNAEIPSIWMMKKQMKERRIKIGKWLL